MNKEKEEKLCSCCKTIRFKQSISNKNVWNKICNEPKSVNYKNRIKENETCELWRSPFIDKRK